MKICPSCETQYTDDTLQFCLQDGTPLVNTEDQTAAPTVAFTSEPETFAEENRQTNRMQFQTADDSPPSEVTKIAARPAEAKKSNTLLIVAVTALTMILLFSAAGIGAWLYFANQQASSNPNSNFSGNRTPAEKEKVLPSSPAENIKTENSPTVRETPAPDFNPEEVKKEVSEQVDSWASALMSRNLSAYMSHYADTVDYFNKRDTGIAAVRADKQRAFNLYDLFEIEVSKMRVVPDASGETATAVFDKEWYFEGDEKTSEGKVQTQLKLRKIGGTWKITSERDLKVYYVR